MFIHEFICFVQIQNSDGTILLLWSVTSEEDAIINAVKTLNETMHGKNNIIFEVHQHHMSKERLLNKFDLHFIQVERLIHVFCGIYDLPLPADLANFDEPSDHQISVAVAQNDEESESSEPENLEEDDSEEDNFDDGYFDEEMKEMPVRKIYFN